MTTDLRGTGGTGGTGGPGGTDGPGRPGTSAVRAPGGSARRVARRTAWALAAAVVVVQIAYPLLEGSATAALHASTVLAVLLFAAASTASALASHGARAAVVLLVVAGGTGLVAESVGVATGLPFGAYAYADTLGPRLAGVPVVVPLAWAMMAWPTLLAGRAVAGALVARSPSLARTAGWLPVPLAAWALAAWDLYLDPQMVAAGHWTWDSPTPALPGVEGIPLTNFAGWLLVAAVMQAALHAAVPRSRVRGRTRRAPPGGAGEQQPVPGGLPVPEGPAAGLGGPAALLLGWTWLGSGLANLAFFDRPAVGLWGLAAMGLVVAPALLVVAGGGRGPRPAPGRPGAAR